MATSFGENLIFDVKSTCSTVEEISDSPCAHFTFSEPGIGISDDREIRESGYVFNDFAELIHGSESNVRDSWWGS